MIPVQYDPAVHEVQEIELARHVRRRLGDPRFFVYHHRVTGNWVLALWRTPTAHDEFLEVRLYANLAAVGRADMVRLERWWRGLDTMENAAKVMQAQHRDKARDRQAKDIESFDQKRFIGRHLPSRIQRDHPFWKQPGWLRSPTGAAA